MHIHAHEHEPMTADAAFNSNAEGIRTIWLALGLLGLTTVLQMFIVTASGSVALLADTAHNLGDTLNSIPLLAAFYLARRAATRRFTYGFGRAEDIAGIIIVLSIAISAAIVLWESVQKLLNPQPMTNLAWVAAAAIIGFLGNEAVAMLQIRTGRKIGSAAMVADGLHARTDGLTSLAVLGAVLGTLIGLPILDPLIGLFIGVTIVFITRSTILQVGARLMDAVDPSITTRIEHYAAEIEGVDQVKSVRVRWIGHRLSAELTLAVGSARTLAENHALTQRVRDSLRAAIPHLDTVVIQSEPLHQQEEATALKQGGILPPRYDLKVPSAAPMGAAALKYKADGSPAWDEIWTDFCDLALAGGPPHRGALLEPVAPEDTAAQPEKHAAVLHELERGIKMVTGLPVVHSPVPGWIGMQCESEEMAIWLLRAIVVENISVRREGDILYFPAGPDFRLEREIKNVITVIAKTTHYWKEHASAE
jgi:cation diffusion facilitator family transporter